MKLEKLNLKYLVRAHTVLGLACIFVFYISTFFGSITLFLPYLNIWESPSKHIKYTSEYNIDEVLPHIIKEYELNSKNIEISLPSFKDPSINISTENQTSITLNPNNNEIISSDFENSTISEFFNEFHYGATIPFVGRTVFGLASLIMIFLMITGVMLFIFNKKKRKKKKEINYKKHWFKWHKNITLALLPFIFVFAITGAFIGFMLQFSTPYALSATNFEENSIRKLVAPIIFAKKKPLENEEKVFTNKNLSFLVSRANEYYPNLVIEKINIYNYNKINSQTHFTGFLEDNRAITGKINRLFLTLDSKSGELIEKKLLEDSHIMNRVMSLFYFLHFIPDETFFLRFLFFILSIAMGVSLVFGYLIWAEKNMKRCGDEEYFNMTNRFSLALFLGVLPASCSVLFMHWYLPLDFYQRDSYIEGLFFTLWAFSLYLAVEVKDIVKTIKIYLLASIGFIVLAMVFHGISTGFHIFNYLQNSLYTLFFVELGFVLAILIFLFFILKIENSFYFRRFLVKKENL